MAIFFAARGRSYRKTFSQSLNNSNRHCSRKL